MPPQTRYARSGDVHLAYQVVGGGPLDLVFVHGWVSNVEYAWEVPPLARFLDRLASFARLILFDRRGTGMSDRVPDRELPPLEQRMDDIRTVMDAVGSERAAIFGASEGGNMSVLFAATYPERTVALVTFGVFAKRIWSPDYPWAPTPEQRQKDFEIVEREWDGEMDVSQYAPSAGRGAPRSDRGVLPPQRQPRRGPGAAAHEHADRRPARSPPRSGSRRWSCTGPAISTPTSRRGAGSRHRIPGARFVGAARRGASCPGWATPTTLLDEVEEFLTGVRRGAEPDRLLATVLFTDIVDVDRDIGDRNETGRQGGGRDGRRQRASGAASCLRWPGKARTSPSPTSRCSTPRRSREEVKALGRKALAMKLRRDQERRRQGHGRPHRARSSAGSTSS